MFFCRLSGFFRPRERTRCGKLDVVEILSAGRVVMGFAGHFVRCKLYHVFAADKVQDYFYFVSLPIPPTAGVVARVESYARIYGFPLTVSVDMSSRT